MGTHMVRSGIAPGPSVGRKEGSLMSGAQVLCPVFPHRSGTMDAGEAMRQIPGGVGIVTGGTEPEFFATTAIAVAPLSMDPPTLIVCVRKTSPRPHVDWAGLRRFAVSILAAQHRAAAERLLTCERIDDDEGRGGIGWLSGPQGSPVIDDGLAAFACVTEDVIERHGQVVMIGRIEEARANLASSALVYWRGEFDRMGWTEAEIACATGLRPR